MPTSRLPRPFVPAPDVCEGDVFASVEHLSPEAVAAFVDEELTPSAANRARAHLTHCRQCQREVQAQTKAAYLLRMKAAEDKICAPRDLMARLSCIDAANVGPGPAAKTHPHGKPEDIFDRLETLVRSLRRKTGY